MFAKHFYGAPKVPLIRNVSPLPNIKKLSFRLSAWDNELLSTPKNYNTFGYFSFSLFFTILAAPTKQFSDVKLLNGIFDQASQT